MIPTIDIFQAAAAYISAHNEAMTSCAYTRNYDNPIHNGIRSACKRTRNKFEQGMAQVKTAAASPEYVKYMGW